MCPLCTSLLVLGRGAGHEFGVQRLGGDAMNVAQMLAQSLVPSIILFTVGTVILLHRVEVHRADVIVHGVRAVVLLWAMRTLMVSFAFAFSHSYACGVISNARAGACDSRTGRSNVSSAYAVHRIASTVTSSIAVGATATCIIVA